MGEDQGRGDGLLSKFLPSLSSVSNRISSHLLLCLHSIHLRSGSEPEQLSLLGILREQGRRMFLAAFSGKVTEYLHFAPLQTSVRVRSGTQVLLLLEKETLVWISQKEEMV